MHDVFLCVDAVSFYLYFAREIEYVKLFCQFCEAFCEMWRVFHFICIFTVETEV